MITTSYDVPHSQSAFVFDLAGSHRTLTYSAGMVMLPEVLAGVTSTLDEFETIVSETIRWVSIIQMRIRPPVLVTEYSHEHFDIGAKVGALWPAEAKTVYFEKNGGPEVAVGFVHAGGVVTWEPRPAVSISHANFSVLTRMAADLIAASRLGARPRVDATVIGPQGPAGPQGIPGPADPLVAWPVGSVLLTKTATSPQGALGGTWALLDTGNLLAGSAGTLWAWRRTA